MSTLIDGLAITVMDGETISAWDGDPISSGPSTSWQEVDPTTLIASRVVVGTDPVDTDWVDDGTDYVIVIDATQTGRVLYPFALVTADGEAVDLTDPTIIRAVMACASISSADPHCAIFIGVKGDNSNSDTFAGGFGPSAFGVAYYEAATETAGVWSLSGATRQISNYMAQESTVSPIDATGSAATLDHGVESLNTSDQPTNDINRTVALAGDYESLFIGVAADGGGSGLVTIKVPNDKLAVWGLSLESMDVP